MTRDDAHELLCSAVFETRTDSIDDRQEVIADKILAAYEADCDAPPVYAEPAGDAVDVRVNLTIDEAGNYLAYGNSDGFELECDWEFQGLPVNVVITARVPLPVVPEIVGTVEPVEAGDG